MNDDPTFDPQWEAYNPFFTRLDVPSKTTLLREGETARQAYYIAKGCLRLWFNDNGKDYQRICRQSDLSWCGL